MVKINTKKAGFSIIEVLFAMVFLSVIIFGVIKLQTSNLTLSNTKQLELKAFSYANQGLEVVSAMGLTKVQSLTCPDENTTCYLTMTGATLDLATNGTEELDGLFYRTITHTEDPVKLPGASLVTATVAWTDSSGGHDVSAKRVIFK